MRTHYEALLRRMGRWWAVDVQALNVHTQCRTLDEAEDMTRDAIAAVLGVPPETIAVDLVVPELAPLLHGVSEARGRTAEAAAAEQRILADVAHTLFEDVGLTQGDACRLLAISPEQAARLLPARGGSRPPRRDGPSTPNSARPAISRSGDGVRPAPQHRRPRSGPADGSPESAGLRPKRQRPARPSWAIADDDADDVWLPRKT